MWHESVDQVHFELFQSNIRFECKFGRVWVFWIVKRGTWRDCLRPWAVPRGLSPLKYLKFPSELLTALKSFGMLFWRILIETWIFGRVHKFMGLGALVPYQISNALYILMFTLKSVMHIFDRITRKICWVVRDVS